MSIVVLSLSIGCSSLRNKVPVRNTLKTPQKVIFQKSQVYTDLGVSNFMNLLKEYADTVETQNKKAALTFADSYMTSLKKNTGIDTMVLTVKNDSIFRHFINNGKTHSVRDLMIMNDSILYKFGKSEYRKYVNFNLFEKNYEYKIEEDLEDKKVVQGLNCHKMVITRLEPENDLGNTINEMYVTNDLSLPLHSVLYVGKLFSNTFPVEATHKSEKLEGLYEHYLLIDIRYE